MSHFSNKCLKKLSLSLQSLSIDIVQKANSGHPGMPMGMADITAVLAAHHLRFHPQDPKWKDRDRFILSNGHGSALQYTLLHMLGYKGYGVQELKRFRQLGSHTPGHPEFASEYGIETTTGPLGQGLANAVGMAIADNKLKGKNNDSKIYCFAGDGCMMEGITQEAASLAGHLGLHNLIVIYDDNSISIDGDTGLAFSDLTADRFRALGWQVLEINGHDYVEIDQAFNTAKKADSNQPVLISAKTHIGYRAPTKQGRASTHGAPLGEDEILLFKKQNDLPLEPFHLTDEAWELWQEVQQSAKNHYKQHVREESDLKDRAIQLKEVASELRSELAALDLDSLNGSAEASRKSSNIMLQSISNMECAVLGSADLTDSNCVRTKNHQPITKEEMFGNFIYYGVREHAMAAVMNGLAIGGLFPIGSTFLTFTDYMRPSIRLGCLMALPLIYVMTHDSIGLGEDGPTHQPIEHLESLRLIPNLQVLRPCDRVECYAAYIMALSHKSPSLIALSRQNLPQLSTDLDIKSYEEFGAKVMWQNGDLNKDYIAIFATGSEVSIAIDTGQKLATEGYSVAVISVLECNKLIENKHAFMGKFLPHTPLLKVAIEAGRKGKWSEIIGEKGVFFGCDHFGASAPAHDVYKHFGLTAEDVATKVMLVLS